MGKQVVIYTRVSSQQQEDGTSPESQAAQCREHCIRKGYEVVAVLHDTASGFESEKWRPKLLEAMQLIEGKKANLLVCWKYDRLARDQGGMSAIVRDIRRMGGDVESAIEGPLPQDSAAAGTFLANLYAFLPQVERVTVILRTRAGL